MKLNVLNAQVPYIPFPNPAFWRVDASDSDVGPPVCSGYYYYHYATSNDTVINSRTYVKIIRSPFVVSGSNPCYYADIAPGYVGALRDDSIANKVFFIYQSQNIDSLLFDYNLNVGDTIKGILAPYYPNAFITSIDSILINSQYHKRWNINFCFGAQFYFIEGIGSSFGLIDHFDCGAGVGSQLICVKDSFGIIYSGSTSPLGCQLINSTNNLKTEIATIKIIPNPVYTESTVIFPTNFFGTIQIINSIGENVLNISEHQITDFKINAENFASGIYFLIANTQRDTYSIKFIIQR